MDGFNEKRKQLLIQLDGGEKVSNIDLGMYDLTPYFSETFNQTLVEKILNIKNDFRQVQHIKDKKICFAPQQEDALHFLRKNDRCILSAPTSFGKTLIVKEYIYIKNPKVIVYIVPTNALAYELENSFKNNSSFSTYSIFDRKKLESSDAVNDEFLLFIGTQEKYLEIKETLPLEIDLFIIDEAYKLEDSTKEQRGYKLSESFLDSITRKSKKIFLLSPNAKFIGFDKYHFQCFESFYNPVDKIFKVVKQDEFYQVLYNKIQENKSILYCDTPKIINDAVDEVCSYFDTDIHNQFIDFLEKEYHPDWTVIKLLKKGILVHHGQMPKYIQNKMINLFNQDNSYSLLIGTNSISEGINTPTKNIFIHPNCDKIKTNKLLLKNTIGRAGRLGEYPIGYIYSVDKIRDIVKENIIIELSISKDDEYKEIENSTNEELIDALCFDYGIDKEFYYMLRKSTRLSISTIKKLFDVLKKDLKYASLSNLPYMAQKVFKEYSVAYVDRICIRGVLQYFYYDDDGRERSLKSYEEKIDFYRSKSNENISNSSIIDNYMRFIYSSLDHYIYPIAKIAMDICEAYPDWNFGNNVLKTIKDFYEKYNQKFLGLENYNFYTEEQKIILQSLKDYGVIINNSSINLEMIIEIENRLNIRYSTYDIINAIKYLSVHSKKNKNKFLQLKNRYID